MNKDSSFSIKSLLSWGVLFPWRSAFRNGDSILMATWFLILYTVFSGAIRKWVTGPGLMGNVVFFIQLLLPIIFYVVVSRSRLHASYRAPAVLTALILYLLVTAMNPMNHTIYHGAFGLIIHVGFWLCIAAYFSKRPFFEIEKFAGLLIAILVLEDMLSSAQYSLPADHILNRLSTGAENDATVGGAQRTSGTFSYVAGLQGLIIFYGFFIWFMLVMKFPSSIISIVFALALFGGMVNGSRGPVATLVGITFFAFMYTGYFAKRFFNIVIQISILTVLVYFYGSNLISRFGVAYENFQQRVDAGNENGEIELRLLDALNEVINFKGNYPIYGIGLGSTYQGANALFGTSSYAKEYGYFEAEPGRIILEGGYILFFLRIILFAVFLRHSAIPPLGRGFIFLAFLMTAVVFNPYISVFFFLGFVMVDRSYFLQQQLKAT